jgi:hypothetical protein
MGGLSGPTIHPEQVVPPPAGFQLPSAPGTPGYQIGFNAAAGRQWLQQNAPFLNPHPCTPLPQGQQADLAEIQALLSQALQAAVQTGGQNALVYDTNARNQWFAQVAQEQAAANTPLTDTNRFNSAIPYVGAVYSFINSFIPAASTGVQTPQTFAQGMMDSPCYRGFSFYPTWFNKHPSTASLSSPQNSDYWAFIQHVDAVLGAYGNLFSIDLLCIFPRQLDEPGTTLSDWPDYEVESALQAAGITSASATLSNPSSLAWYCLDKTAPKYLLEALPDPTSASFGQIAGQGGVPGFTSWLSALLGPPPGPAPLPVAQGAA